jgi:hypothetical protein
MKFGIHNSSWLDAPDPAETFEAVKTKAQWAENHGFVWFSVLDHMIQIPRVGAPDESVLEGWTVLAGLAAITGRIRLRHSPRGRQLRDPDIADLLLSASATRCMWVKEHPHSDASFRDRDRSCNYIGLYFAQIVCLMKLTT